MFQQPGDLRKEYGEPFAIFSREEGSIYKSRDFNPPRSLDLGLIENPDARRSVEAHCRTLGLRKAVEMRHDALTKLEKCLLRIKKLKEEAANLVNDMHQQDLGSFDNDDEVRLTSNSSKGISEKDVEYRGVTNDLVARMTALAYRKKEADAAKQRDSQARKQSSSTTSSESAVSTLVTHVPILSTYPSGDLGSKGSKKPLVPVCEETEDLRLKKVPKCPGKSSVPILGLDDNLVSKYNDSKSTKDIAAEGFLAEKERMEAKYTALETEKNKSLRVNHTENDALRAELGRLRKEKLKMESDPMQSLQKIIVYTDYLCFFDSARTLLQSGQSVDVILNEIREYTLKTPLYAGFLLPVLDLEVYYKVDLSWWPDRDQLISP